MRTWIIALILLLFCFLVPLQCFIIGNDLGFGVQGAAYRYQMTVIGNSFIPITYELGYVTDGIYQGKNAISVILWTVGTLVLAGTTILALISWKNLSRRSLKWIIIGITGSCILYLASCVTRYGPFFSGPPGTSMPLGVIMLTMVAIFLYSYQDLFFDTNERSR